MKETFVESGMTFEFDSDNLFHIERSADIVHLQSFKPCECVVRSGKFLDLIEAKTNAPNPNNKENKENIDMFYNEIERKFIDTLFYTTGITVKRHIDTSCPANVRDVSIANIKYRFIIIIKELEERHLPDQLSYFKKVLKHITKAWKIDDSCIKVLNEAEARRLKLIR